MKVDRNKPEARNLSISSQATDKNYLKRFSKILRLLGHIKVKLPPNFWSPDLGMVIFKSSHVIGSLD